MSGPLRRCTRFLAHGSSSKWRFGCDGDQHSTIALLEIARQRCLFHARERNPRSRKAYGFSVVFVNPEQNF
jgi:hypothetical protein